MMTMSKPLGAGQAQRYHHEQLRDVGENDYSEGQETLGEWHGRLAAAWGLEGLSPGGVSGGSENGRSVKRAPR